MHWNNIAPLQYELKQDFQTLATFQITSKGAVCHTARRTLFLKRQGFWKSTLEMTDATGQILLRLKPLHWYGAQYTCTLNGVSYCLDIINQPLAHFVLTRDGQKVLSYGLVAENGRTQTTIQATDLLPAEQALELHLLMWYLFQPIAKGETGADSVESLDVFLSTT